MRKNEEDPCSGPTRSIPPAVPLYPRLTQGFFRGFPLSEKVDAEADA